MEQPKHKTRDDILEKYYNRIYFYVCSDAKCKNVVIEPCMLSKTVEWKEDLPAIDLFDKDMNLMKIGRPVLWAELHDGWEVAERMVKHLNKLYTKGFYRRPYVSTKILEEHKGAMVKIEKDIRKGLKAYHTFKGIDFFDFGENGIAIRGFHLSIEGYTYGKHIILKYDFSNKDTVAKEFIEMWKKFDTPQRVKEYKSFIKDGKKYGWD